MKKHNWYDIRNKSLFVQEELTKELDTGGKEMSDFSEYLDNYMKEHSITSSELSRETHIERTVIYKWRNGRQHPRDENNVVCIADALRMSVVEKQNLIDMYDRISLGELTVNSYYYIKDLLKKLKSTNKNSAPLTLKWDTPWEKEMQSHVTNLHSGDEIVSCITHLFTLLLEQENEIITLYLMMQPQYEIIQKRIQAFFRGTSVKIEQIVCLEQSFHKSYKNLEIFQWILPLCFEQLN